MVRDEVAGMLSRSHAGKLLLAAAVTATVVATSAPVRAQAPAWHPDKQVEIIVAATAGGGADLTARTVQKIWQAKGLPTVVVVNKPGGGGAIAYTYLVQRPADPHVLLISTPNLLTNNIVGISTIKHSDVTPIALLFSEYLAFAVKADSPIRTAADLTQRLKSDPAALSIGISPSVGGVTHIATALAMKAAGVDIRKLKFVAFKSGAESAVALLGGHIDMNVASSSNVVPHMRSGALRIIAVSSGRRVGGALAEVPTWREQGINSVSVNWRALVAPRGLDRAQIAYWENAATRLVESDEWKKEVEKNLWETSYMNSADTRKYFDSQHDELKGVLTELGLAK